MNQTNEWVLILQNSAAESYQVLDETCDERPKKPGWLRLCLSVIAYGCNLYGIPMPL